MKVKQLRKNLERINAKLNKIEKKLNDMPNIRPVCRRSKNGDWIITGMEMVDIRSSKYYKKMLNSNEIDNGEEVNLSEEVVE